MPKKQLTIGYLSDECSLASVGLNDKYDRKACLKTVSSDGTVPLTVDYSDESAAAVAYYPIFGFITYDWPWCFSTRRFMEDLKAAEENPTIKAHLLHVNSPGGEAFGMHETFELIRSLKKPVYAFVEAEAESGGYYLASAAGKVYASSIFSKVGCIGAMAEFCDTSEYEEKQGIRYLTVKSTWSPLKNKAVEDVLAGDTEEYVKEFLDPLARTFIDDVASVRKAVAADSDALKGKTYFASVAQGEGLVDGIMTFDEVMDEILSAEMKSADDINLLNINLN